jgi:hypothetical protein
MKVRNIWMNTAMGYLRALRWLSVERKMAKRVRKHGNMLGFKQGAFTV